MEWGVVVRGARGGGGGGGGGTNLGAVSVTFAESQTQRHKNFGGLIRRVRADVTAGMSPLM